MLLLTEHGNLQDNTLYYGLFIYTYNGYYKFLQCVSTKSKGFKIITFRPYKKKEALL